jgi:hypothetical protein
MKTFRLRLRVLLVACRVSLSIIGGRFLIFLIMLEFFLLILFISYVFSGFRSFFFLGVGFLTLVACGASVGLSILTLEGRKTT